MSLPNVTITAPWRDNAEQVHGFAKMVEAQTYPLDHLRVLCVEGDSTDNTVDILRLWAAQNNQVTVLKRDTNEKRWPSVVNVDRFAHLAKVFNPCLEEIDWGWSDYSLFIPSDVSFSPDLVMSLVIAEKDLISPMFWIGDFHNGDCRFYDIWGFVQRGGKKFPPYSFAWYQHHMPGDPFEVDYIGGAMLCRRKVIESGVRYTPDKADHGLCETARANGFTLWCHPGTHIVHR